VFDHGWAGVASRYGLAYYPKLQSCVPFSPVTGPRLLVNAPGLTTEVTQALIKLLKTVAGESRLPLFIYGGSEESKGEPLSALFSKGFLSRWPIVYKAGVHPVFCTQHELV
jgi:uncharacterized protein